MLAECDHTSKLHFLEGVFRDERFLGLLSSADSSRLSTTSSTLHTAPSLFQKAEHRHGEIVVRNSEKNNDFTTRF